MSVNIEGVDEPTQQLESLDGEHSIPISELFTPRFMQTHSDVETFESSVEESPWTVETEDDFKSIPETEWDDYVESNTVFKDWDSMLSTAFREWASQIAQE
jgi:4-alpha-glucanotransferase